MKLPFVWDYYSDQPYILKKEDKKRLRKGYTLDFLKLFLTNIIYFPYLLIKFFIIKLKKSSPEVIDKRLFYGVCVNLDKGVAQYELVEELGVESLQMRFFLNDMVNIDTYVEFVKGFGDKNILITVIQSREHIEDSKLLRQDIKIVFEKFKDISNEFMIGNATNRIKWGFVTIEEYLRFYEIVQSVRDEYFKDIKLVGSSIIDFEYHFTIRTLFNHFKIRFDAISSLLYVDRRGSPKNKQYLIFDLNNKIIFLKTIIKASYKTEKKIYITETNWPLSGTAPYAPTSEKECVNEEDYSTFMLEYFDITLKNAQIERVYWHQLISAGYGLVDNRNGILRKRKAFYAFKRMISENIY